MRTTACVIALGLGIAPLAAATAQSETMAQRGTYPSDVVELPDGQLLVLHGVSGARVPEPADALLVDAASGETTGVYARQARGMLRGALSPAGDALATWPNGGQVKIAPLAAGVDGSQPKVLARSKAGEVLLPLKAREGWGSYRCRWSHDGEFLLVWFADFDHRRPTSGVQLWSRQGELLWTSPPASQGDLHPSRNQLAVVTPDALLVGWPGGIEDPLHDGVATLSLHGAFGAVQFRPDGKQIAVGGTGPAVEGKPYDLKRGAGGAWLWVVDAESREVRLSKAVRGIDSMELRGWLQRLRWSPDGSLIGVSLGKGHAVGALAANDGSVVWSGDMQGGRMGEIFDVGWTDSGRLHTGWGQSRLIDPRDPASAVTLERLLDARVINLSGTDDVILFFGKSIARIDPVTGERRWTR